MRSFLSKVSVQLGAGTAGDAEVVDLLQKLLVYVGPVRSFVCLTHTPRVQQVDWWDGAADMCQMIQACGCLSWTLRYDHYDRLSAEEALAHPYFRQ
jgi:hypothetical protein